MADKDLYNAIVAHREKFTRIGGVDYSSHFPPTLNPLPPEELIDKWKMDYKKMQEEMIYGQSLSFDKLLSRIKSITNRINKY